MATIVSPVIELKAHTKDPELLIEQAARCCYKSEGRTCPGSHLRILNVLKTGGHDSVLEHASATFFVRTDRGITHEIVRHRIGMSYSQESTRYVDYVIKDEVAEDAKGNIDLQVIPPIGLNEETMRIFMAGIQAAETIYRDLRKNGCIAQEARDVLPTCLKADIWITGNFRAWLHFLKLRTSKKAHPKIQVVAREIGRQLHGISPTVFQDYA